MGIKALVIGYGSIGKIHAEVLHSMDDVSSVSVLSSQKELPFATIKSFKEIEYLDPDYIVIATPTAEHFSQLKFIDENLQGKKILVEKPLFHTFYEIDIRGNHVFVGYNLRFHPLLQKTRDLITCRTLWNIEAFCYSYLPDWRPEKDYRKTYSAKLNCGGGVLMDLSHELDYVQWLVGKLHINHKVSKKVSNLEIDSDDLLLLSGKTERDSYFHISLNYFSRKPLRQVLIEGEDISICGNFISSTLDVVVDGKESSFAWTEMHRKDMYRSQHRAIIKEDMSVVCNFEEGLSTVKLIDNIREFDS